MGHERAHMSELRPKSLDAILEWWAQELGISGADLGSTQPGVTLSGNPLLSGVCALQRGDIVRIAASPGKLEPIRDAIVDKKIAKIFTPEFWKKNLKELAGKIIGPTVLYYIDKAGENWKAMPNPHGFTVRGLAVMDQVAFAEFAATLPVSEREFSGLEFGPQPMWGAFSEKKLIAVAGYDAWPGKISHVCAGVRPSFRGKGLGRAVVLAAVKGALTRKRIVQFRTLAGNEPAIRIAKSLGMEFFGQTIYVRATDSP